jgi:phosphatidylglycerol lysyltransferase
VDLPPTPTTRHCLAYSQVTGDLATFGDAQGGTLLYRTTRLGATLAVGDPIAEAWQVESLLDRFLQAHPHANFIQCSEAIARQLQARAFFVNSFGVETDLVLSHWNCLGKRAHMLRKNFNKAERLGVTVVEITHSVEQLEQARQVSNQWLFASHQSHSELALLTRPPVFLPENGTRKFASFFNGQMTGIGFFDPLCLKESSAGYVYQLLRESPEAPPGTRTHLLLTVAEQFRAAGLERLSLGLSPNCLAETEPLHYSRFTRRVLQSARRWAWYNYEGQQFYKSRFGGEERTVFAASRSRFPLPLLIALGLETGIFRTYWDRLRHPMS